MFNRFTFNTLLKVNLILLASIMTGYLIVKDIEHLVPISFTTAGLCLLIAGNAGVVIGLLAVKKDF